MNRLRIMAEAIIQSVCDYREFAKFIYKGVIVILSSKIELGGLNLS